MQEIWKDIENYEGLYKISNFGNIKAMPKKAGFNNRKEKLLKYKINQFGYLTIGLCKNSKRKWFMIHRLIANAFISSIKNKPQVNHKDGNKQNNHIDNLEWCTSSENLKHAFKIGLRNGNGEKHSQHKLKNEDILWIRKNHQDYSRENLSKKYNISKSNLCLIINNKTWNHI